MARPNKRKRICRLPVYSQFFTKDREETRNQLILSVEEFETLRLLDYIGMTQEECAEQMGVGRATVQNLYTEARKKIVRFLVEGTGLLIEGGNYTICPSQTCSEEIKEKGVFKMKIAVTYQDGMVFQHFGHTEQFKVYTVEDGKLISEEVVGTNGQGHGALAGFLKENGVDTLICGGIGAGARNALSEAGIQLFPGAAGNADEQVNSFLAGKLSYDPNTKCSHHSHAHQGEGHTCGAHHYGHEHGHSCGSHGCGGHGQHHGMEE